MASSRCELSFSCNWRNPEFLGKLDVGSIVGRKIVTQMRYARQENGMSVPSDAEIQQVAGGLLKAIYRDRSFQR